MIEYVDPAPTFCRAVKHNGVIYFSGHCDGKSTTPSPARHRLCASGMKSCWNSTAATRTICCL